jgi:DNA-binding HxlR family transcriptional regulator
MKPGNLHETGPCRKVSQVLSRIGDKWSVLVVMQLGEKPRRFNELRRELGSISQKMLSATLRGLERDGFVSRTVHATVPPRVDYALTELGRDLLCPVGALGEWAIANIERIEAARRRFDESLEHEPGAGMGRGAALASADEPA